MGMSPGPSGRRKPMRRIPIVLAASLLAAALAPLPVGAEVDEATRAARWDDLRRTIFGDRTVEDGAGLVSIDAPSRAEDAALVPVKIAFSEALRREVRQLYFVIDDNPSPLAGHFTFGPAAEPSSIATRVRVDDYTYFHAVAETADGRLYGVAHFIKAAGGCSAPAGKDQELALQRLGRMKMTLKGLPRIGQPVEAHLLISHPNNSGMQMDQVTRHYTPADFVRTIRVTYNGETVLTLDSDISISEDPSLTFAFIPKSPSGEITSAIEDSNDRRFEQSWPVKVEPGS
jgi:sulfur-oxidizing protein SoxY